MEVHFQSHCTIFKFFKTCVCTTANALQLREIVQDVSAVRLQNPTEHTEHICRRVYPSRVAFPWSQTGHTFEKCT